MLNHGSREANTLFLIATLTIETTILKHDHLHSGPDGFYRRQ